MTSIVTTSSSEKKNSRVWGNYACHLRRIIILAVLLVIVLGIMLFDMSHQQLKKHSNGQNYNEDLKLIQQLPTNETGQYYPRRRLFNLANFHDPSSIALKQPFGISDVHYNSNNIASTQFELPNLAPYNHYNLMVTAPAFKRELFILYYEPQQDEFLVYVDERKDPYYVSKGFSPTWNRLKATLPTLTFALRHHFPERFQGAAGGSAEFIAYVSTGDTPKLDCVCILKHLREKRPNYCQNEKFAPILHFGSVYKDTSILPSVVTMPVWAHVPCFGEWQMQGTICEERILRRDVAGKMGGVDTTPVAGWLQSMSEQKVPYPWLSTWDKLIPTLIWRGTDYTFLMCIRPKLLIEGQLWGNGISPRLETLGKTTRGVVQSLLDIWDILLPRWKGVAFTAAAQLEAQEAGSIGTESPPPWIDVKFTVKSKVHDQPVEPDGRYDPFLKYGIDVTSGPMTLAELSQYKYHIDIGGGGGTTWSGTIEKLAMPGVLFHHLSATKDYFHDDLLPWRHYIPINEDFSNLREMYDWAKENNEQAKKISEAGTEYVKSQAKPEVIHQSYERYFVHSLKKVVDAYLPIEDDLVSAQVDDWLFKWSLIGKCTGNDEKCQLKDYRVYNE